MANHQDNDVESRILEAATTVFIQKGLSGASMQDIANEAGISRTSLHYYYRSKDKLFEKVFEHVVGALISQQRYVINADMPLVEKMNLFVDHTLNFLLDNPGSVSFLVHELNATPERMIELIISRNLDIEKLKIQIAAEIKNNRRSEFDAAQFWASLIGMCIMPFVAKPMIVRFFLDESEEQFREFIHNRKQHILDFLMKYIKN
jgi:AcrR family transcriptional regulator